MRRNDRKSADVALREKVCIPVTEATMRALRELAERRGVALAQVAREMIGQGLVAAGAER